MVRYLKTGISEEKERAVDTHVRKTVETILEDVRQRGEKAVRELSERFDHWSPESFRLSQTEIEQLISSLPEQTVEDIKFAQAQVKRFAAAQRPPRY